MKAEIIEHIKLLEKEREITILLAAESGSRAWGCPSPDSDYDVRIIFKRTQSEYLEIDEKKDTIDYFHGELLDINGWDIKKTLRLIRKSNATPFEWAQSPIVYHEKAEFRKTLLDLCKTYFQPRHSVNHYMGIAKNSYSSLSLGETIKLKKLFYVLRPLMAAKWILEKKEIPPMDIRNLIQIIPDKTIVNHVEDLLVLKSTSSEDYVHKVDPMLTSFIAEEFAGINLDTLPIAESNLDTSILNDAFKKIIA